MGPTRKCGWYTWWHSAGENWFFSFPSSISGNSCLFESGTLGPLPLLSSGNLSGLTLCSPTHNVTVSASSCVPTPCWIWKKLFAWSCPSPLVLTLFLPPLQHPTPNLDGEDLTMTFHSRVSNSSCEDCSTYWLWFFNIIYAHTLPVYWWRKFIRRDSIL